MGKKNKFTGSKLLGAELRRLRQERMWTLADIAKLSETLGDELGCGPISAPTLSQIENGISMPSLNSLNTLSMIYKVSPRAMFDLITQERVIAGTPEPKDAEDAKTLFAAELRAGDYYDAMGIAVRAELMAGRDTPARLLWRANRAVCLNLIGMRQDAIWMLLEVLDEHALPEQLSHEIHRNVAAAFLAGGLLDSALLHADAARRLLPAEHSDSLERDIQRLRADVYMAQCEQRPSEAHALAASALEAVQRVEALIPTSDAHGRLQARLQRARCERWMGRLARAEQQLRVVLGDAASAAPRLRLEEMLARHDLGVVLLEVGRLDEARLAFEAALAIADARKDHEWAFECCFRLHAILRERDPGQAEIYLRACRSHYPHVSTKTPSVTAFRALVDRR